MDGVVAFYSAKDVPGKNLAIAESLDGTALTKTYDELVLFF